MRLGPCPPRPRGARRAPAAHGPALLLGAALAWLLGAGLAWLAVAASPVAAQVQLPGVVEPQVEPLQRAAQVERPPNRVRRRLSQLDAIVADQQWAEATELLRSLIDDPASATTVVEASPDYFVSLAEHCHTRIAALPAEALERYRAAVDPFARERYERAAKSRDESLLREIVADAFCSSWGDNALVLLGEMALERGDFGAAHGHWRRVSPLLSDPGGRPLSWALAGVDLTRHGEEVLARLTSAPREGGWLVYPDSDVPAADLLARMAVASHRAGEKARARTELAWLRVVAPSAEGWIAGRVAPLADTVAALLAEPDPSSAAGEGVAGRVGPLRGRLWPNPRPLSPTPITPNNPAAVTGAPLCEPAVWGRVVVYRDNRTLQAADLITSAPAVTKRGELHRDTQPARRGQRLFFGQIRNFNQLTSGLPELLEGATIAGDSLVTRATPDPAAGPPPDRPGVLRIVARDLRRQNVATLDLEPPAAPWFFGGPPVVDAARLYAPLIALDVRPRVAVACYSAVTGRELWRTPIASGAPPRVFARPSPPPCRLVLSEDAIYFNTHFGAAAAVERHDGRVRWLVRYPQRTEPQIVGTSMQAALVRQAWQTPWSLGGAGCVVDAGRVYLAPRDADSVFAVDAATGRPVWRAFDRSAEELSFTRTDDRQLLGVADGVLVVGGGQLTGLDAATGATRYRWPESRHAGLRGVGRGCLAGGEVFWPTTERVFVLDAATGAATRPPLDIKDLGGGANLLAARGLLVAAGPRALTVFGPAHREAPVKSPQILQTPSIFPGGQPPIAARP